MGRDTEKARAVQLEVERAKRRFFPICWNALHEGLKKMKSDSAQWCSVRWQASGCKWKRRKLHSNTRKQFCWDRAQELEQAAQRVQGSPSLKIFTTWLDQPWAICSSWLGYRASRGACNITIPWSCKFMKYQISIQMEQNMWQMGEINTNWMFIWKDSRTEKRR